MNIEDFSYYLPTDHIAQKPACPRDHSRLMVLDRRKNNIEHCFFYQLPHFLSNDDLLVMNNSRVIPARLYGHKITGGSVEILLLHRKSTHIWEAITHPGLRMHQSVYLIPHTTTKNLTQNVTARVVEKKQDGTTRLHFNVDLNRYLSSLGHTPLPPYIKNLGYKARWYQTLYAIKKGSVAAPTAGLHFTKRLFNQLKRNHIRTTFVTLHIGLGTFAPIKTSNVTHHTMHAELGEISPHTARLITQAKQNNQRIIAVGTSTVRLLEHVANLHSGSLRAFKGWVNNFIIPPYTFKYLDGLITNFHLPRSTLLLLVSAFAGREKLFKAYKEAIENKYRFYSFGDAMLII